ncbi:hypothetical protein [Chryseobacterium sp. FH1]|uniref:hypothetical protein n=1 Tax=Chryseobacterium sp. FH1 TaxID=1233951 RepID=UPI0013F42EE7|nr:hypothetical protein [Chryseobacterium sp. FH1]
MTKLKTIKNKLWVQKEYTECTAIAYQNILSNCQKPLRLNLLYQQSSTLLLK